MNEAEFETRDGELFGTATVVQRTGLSAARIRMWEKRYGAVEPQRTETQRRLYTRDDLERLALMRRLTEAGHAIRHIAGHSRERLRALVDDELAAGRGPRRTGSGAGRVLVVSAAGESLLGEEGAVDFEWSSPFDTLAEALASPAAPAADVLLVETDTLFEETVEAALELASRCGAGRTLVAYRFAGRGVAAAVEARDPGVVLLRGPRDAGRLRRECVFQLDSLAGGALPADAGTIPARRFDPGQLARLAGISSAIDCECPRHMAELLRSLSAFEAYSEACEDRNNDDALVHAFLHRTTARVRRTMEDALQYLLQAEGIRLD